MTYPEILKEAQNYGAQLIAVSKTQSVEKIQALYDQGQRDFGENRVQEILEKKPQLPDDIRWHLIGQLQTNKVKKIVDQVAMIQSIDSARLLSHVQTECEKKDIHLDVLLQMFIAEEETKSGMDEAELQEIISNYKGDYYPHLRIRGLMGISTFTSDMSQVQREFTTLKEVYDKYRAMLPEWDVLSMGMSSDYRMALESGSTMIRVGSLIFGNRN